MDLGERRAAKDKNEMHSLCVLTKVVTVIK
jgi:hypothetical protein